MATAVPWACMFVTPGCHSRATSSQNEPPNRSTASVGGERGAGATEAIRLDDLPIIYGASQAPLSSEREAKLRRIARESRPKEAKKELWFIYWHREDQADI